MDAPSSCVLQGLTASVVNVVQMNIFILVTALLARPLYAKSRLLPPLQSVGMRYALSSVDAAITSTHHGCRCP